MGLDKLGAITVQKQGAQDSNRVYDQINHRVLKEMLLVLQDIRSMMIEMTDTEDLE